MQIEKKWYICIAETVIGPFDSAVVIALLQQNRLQFMDFIWTAGLSEWTHISNISEFASFHSPFPRAPLPDLTLVDDSGVETAGGFESPPTIRVRNNERVAVEGKLFMGELGDYKVINLSPGGLFVAGKCPVALGSQVKFALLVAGCEKPLDMKGLVLRNDIVKGIPGFAMEFVNLSPANLRVLTEFTDLRKARAG